MRLGRAQKVRGPGTVFVFPFIEKATRIDVRVISVELPSFQVITNDRGLVEASIVVFFKVIDPMAAYCGVQNRDQVFLQFRVIIKLKISILIYFKNNFFLLIKNFLDSSVSILQCCA